MQNQGYTATNTGRPFSFKAMTIGAKLKADGYTDKEIREKSKNENIFQSRSEHQRIKTASTVSKRLNMLDEQLISKLITGDSTTIKQIIIYSIMKSDRFFFEFMDEVYKDKMLWARKSLNNIATSGIFSADRAIREYADNIWNLKRM